MNGSFKLVIAIASYEFVAGDQIIILEITRLVVLCVSGTCFSVKTGGTIGHFKTLVRRSRYINLQTGRLHELVVCPTLY